MDNSARAPTRRAPELEDATPCHDGIGMVHNRDGTLCVATSPKSTTKAQSTSKSKNVVMTHIFCPHLCDLCVFVVYFCGFSIGAAMLYDPSADRTNHHAMRPFTRLPEIIICRLRYDVLTASLDWAGSDGARPEPPVPHRNMNEYRLPRPRPCLCGLCAPPRSLRQKKLKPNSASAADMAPATRQHISNDISPKAPAFSQQQPGQPTPPQEVTSSTIDVACVRPYSSTPRTATRCVPTARSAGNPPCHTWFDFVASTQGFLLSRLRS